jgi:hypothetical protein
MKLFSRKKSLETICKDILKSIKDLSYQEKLTILTTVIQTISKDEIKEIPNQVLLDLSLLYILSSTYPPRNVIIHLGFITKKLLEMNPELQEEINKNSIVNGVV